MGAPAVRAAEVQTLRRGIELGMRHIDTAEMYGGGAAEEMVGDAIAGLPRDSLFIVSKVLPQNASRQGTIAACEASLRRLRCGHLDAYLLHWRGRHPLADTLQAMEELVDAGKIRALGVSNFDVPDLEEALGLLKRHPIVCNQVLYHLEERYPEGELLRICTENQIALVGYSPFGTQGFPPVTSAKGRVLAAIAARHGEGVTARQVALAFLVRRAPLFAIPKASSIAHVEENAAAARLSLTDVDLQEIEARFPRPASSDGLPMA
jgi:diketogulonate reductase-like aldo/keto reductase